MSDPDFVTNFARTNFRGDRRVFGIRRADRRAHMYIIGKTGTGKSTLLETMIRQDIKNGDGLALLDPHGDLVEKVLDRLPENRRADLIYFDVPDRNQTVGFNPLGHVAEDKRPLAASGLIEVFKKLWADSWGPRMEYILRNTVITLLDKTDSTLADIPKLLDDKAFRKAALFYSRNEHVRRFWLKEYEGYPARLRAEAIAPIQNKVGTFLSNPVLKKILTESEIKVNLRKIMDDRQVLLVNLAKGKIGEDTAALLGALLVSRFALAALSRANIAENDRRDFYLYLDEFQAYGTLSLANMLSELRKYRLSMVLSHQFLTQLTPELQAAILGNVGSTIAFRVGAEDAEILEKEFHPEFSATDLVNLPNYSIYLKLMVDGAVSRPFSGETLRPPTLS